MKIINPLVIIDRINEYCLCDLKKNTTFNYSAKIEKLISKHDNKRMAFKQFRSVVS
jgi:hypothetical protein